MRRTSVSLPTKHIAYDPHEKPDRYGVTNRDPSLSIKMQSAWASQSQRARYIKAGAIIFVVFCLFYYFSPAGVDLYNGGRFWPGRRPSVCLGALLLTSLKDHPAPTATARRRPTRHMAPTDARGLIRRISPLCSTFS